MGLSLSLSLSSLSLLFPKSSLFLLLFSHVTFILSHSSSGNSYNTAAAFIMIICLFFYFQHFLNAWTVFILRQRSNYLSLPPTSQSAITLSSLSLLFPKSSLFLLLFSHVTFILSHSSSGNS